MSGHDPDLRREDRPSFRLANGDAVGLEAPGTPVDPNTRGIDHLIL
jgi:hypothetical protein